MRILNRYILREVAWPAILALVVLGFIFVFSEFRERKDIAYAYATVRDIGLMMVYLLPSLLPRLIPVGYMMGVLLAFSAFVNSNEITAMRTAGVSLKQVLVPVIAGGVLLSAFAFILQDRVQPMALRKFNELVYFDMALRGTLDVLPTGVMHRFGDWRVYIGSKDSETGTLRDVEILVPSEGDPRVFYAKEAQLHESDGQQWIRLRGGYYAWTTPDKDLAIGPMGDRRMNLPRIAAVVQSGRLQMLPLERLLDFQAGKGSARDYGGPDPKNPKQVREARLEIGDRFAFPLACLAVSLVAAPLAVRARRGGKSYSFAIGFGVGIVFYLLHVVLQPQSVASLSETLLRSLAPNLVLGLAGLVLLWRVDRV